MASNKDQVSYAVRQTNSLLHLFQMLRTGVSRQGI